MLTQLFYAKRAKRIAMIIRPMLRAEWRVLDVGAGSMEVAKELSTKVASITGVDVIDINKTGLPFEIFDGIKLPFPDKSFDCVMIIFVLHHMSFDKQLRLLNECRRVAKRAVIVAEDVFNNTMEKIILGLLDNSNWLLSKEMSLPHTFRKEKEWENTFRKLSFKKIVKHIMRPNPLRPSRHRLFVMEV
jgi:ubiquinone/menaquinone biosynthesis C-methylase UbiE